MYYVCHRVPGTVRTTYTCTIKWTLKYTQPGGHVCTTQKSSEFVTLSFIELKSYTCKFILIMYPGITCVPGVHSLLATSTVVYVWYTPGITYHKSYTGRQLHRTISFKTFLQFRIIDNSLTNQMLHSLFTLLCCFKSTWSHHVAFNSVLVFSYS